MKIRREKFEIIFINIMQNFIHSQKKRIIIISTLIIIFIILSFFIQRNGSETVYTHLYYIPIILVCVWWQKKGIMLAFGFGIFLLTLHLFLRPEVPIFDDILRSSIFIVIAIFVTKLSQKENSYKMLLEKTVKDSREGNEYLNKLFDYANVPIIVWDNNKKVTRFNNTFQSMTGYSKEFILGKEIEILFPVKEQTQTLKIIKKAIIGWSLKNVEVVILCKNKKEKILLWNSANIVNEKGKIVATIAQGHDITVRKVLEKEMEKKIDKKTKELQFRVKELERFHKLTVDRELKMIELKEELKKLKNK